MTASNPGRALRRRAERLAEGFLRERKLDADTLSPAARDALREWSEAETRLRAHDDKGDFDRWHVAAQNSAARLRRDLESRIEESIPERNAFQDWIDRVGEYAGDDAVEAELEPDPLNEARAEIRKLQAELRESNRLREIAEDSAAFATRDANAARAGLQESTGWTVKRLYDHARFNSIEIADCLELSRNDVRAFLKGDTSVKLERKTPDPVARNLRWG